MINNKKQKYKESKTELLNLNNSFQLHLIPKILKSLQSNTVPEYILGLKKLKDCIPHFQLYTTALPTQNQYIEC